jgi:hypothetical protein
MKGKMLKKPESDLENNENTYLNAFAIKDSICIFQQTNLASNMTYLQSDFIWKKDPMRAQPSERLKSTRR